MEKKKRSAKGGTFETVEKPCALLTLVGNIALIPEIDRVLTTTVRYEALIFLDRLVVVPRDENVAKSKKWLSLLTLCTRKLSFIRDNVSFQLRGCRTVVGMNILDTLSDTGFGYPRLVACIGKTR